MDDLSTLIVQHYNYWVSIVLMLIGFYAVIKAGNLIKKLIGLAIFQTSVLLFYISSSAVRGAHIPILEDGVNFYVNPLPHVLMLTAIVVGVATLAVGLAIAVRIKEEYGTIEEDLMLQEDAKATEHMQEEYLAVTEKLSRREEQEEKH